MVSWGVVMAPRMTKIKRDGRSAVQKAQDLKKDKNLEVPKGKTNVHGFHNYFAALDNHELLHKASSGGVLLGEHVEMINQNI